MILILVSINFTFLNHVVIIKKKVFYKKQKTKNRKQKKQGMIMINENACKQLNEISAKSFWSKNKPVDEIVNTLFEDHLNVKEFNPKRNKKNQKKCEELNERRADAFWGGGFEKIEQQHAKGRLTARERIEQFFDDNTFEEFDTFKTHRCYQFGMSKKKIYGDGIVTGVGTVSGRIVYACAQDFTVFGGSISETMSQKVSKMMDLAAKNGAPIVYLNDSGGARIQEGVDSLAGCSEMFLRNVKYSGVIPQISIIFGPCAGAAVYSPALTDFIVMVKKKSFMFLTGPKVVKGVTHEDVDEETLGGADVHDTLSGLVHYAAQSELDAISYVQKLLSFIPQNNQQRSPMLGNQIPDCVENEFLNQIIPDSANQPYDMKELIDSIVDDQDFFEIQKNFAANIIIGFAHIGGRSIGIVANQPQVMAGVLDINASIKAARFVRFCDCFNIPILTLVDVPGFLPGTNQEHNGVIRNGAKLIYAYAEATVPKITIVTRKAYGGAYCVMSSKHLRGDLNFAWPTAEIAVMGSKGAAEILHGKESKKSIDPENFLKEKESEYEKAMLSPYPAAERGYIDDIIIPSQTRLKIIKSLWMLRNKEDSNPSKKHGNMPL